MKQCNLTHEEISSIMFKVSQYTSKVIYMDNTSERHKTVVLKGLERISEFVQDYVEGLINELAFNEELSFIYDMLDVILDMEQENVR